MREVLCELSLNGPLTVLLYAFLKHSTPLCSFFSFLDPLSGLFEISHVLFFKLSLAAAFLERAIMLTMHNRTQPNTTS